MMQVSIAAFSNLVWDGETEEGLPHIEIPLENYTIHKPVFFGAALQDFVCLAAVGKHAIQQFCPRATVVDFDTDHWVMLADPHNTNAELLKWIEALPINQSSL